MTATASTDLSAVPPDVPPDVTGGSPAVVPDAAAPLTVAGPAGARSGPATGEPSIGKLVHDASEQVSTLIRGEIALAKLELRSTIKNAGTGIGLFAGAAVVLVFSLVFAFLTLAEGLAALGLARWLAFLIVFLLQLAIVAALAFLGLRQVKKVRAPQQTLTTTRETLDYLKRSRG